MARGNIKVPLFKQKEKTCGPTALRMVCAYFGEKIRESEIVENVGGIRSYGVRTVHLAEYARERGFNVECLSYNKDLADGKAKIKKPSKKDILKFLKKEIPVILAVKSYLLYGKRHPTDGHFIVVTGYGNDFFLYNDPYDGKRHKIAEDALMFAWFNHVPNSSAYLLAIWRK